MRAQQMKMFSLVAVVALLGLASVGAETASAKRTWWYCVKAEPAKTGKFETKACTTENAKKEGEWESKGIPNGVEESIEAHLKAGTEATLISKVGGQEAEIKCKKLKLKHRNGGVLEEHGFIYNFEGRTGRDRGVVVFEECRVAGIAALVCKLTAASAKEIITPPTAEGASLLVQTKSTEPTQGSKEIWDDFLPEELTNAKGVKFGLFALIHIEGGSCPVKPPNVDQVVCSKAKVFGPVGLPGAANEGECGYAAEIKPESYAIVQSFVFSSTKPCAKKFWNWKGNEIKANELEDLIGEETKLGEGTFEGEACFSAEAEAELWGANRGNAWDVR